MKLKIAFKKKVIKIGYIYKIMKLQKQKLHLVQNRMNEGKYKYIKDTKQK